MGCQKLGTDFCNFLKVIHPEKRGYGEKKCVNYYPFGLKHKGYNNVVNGSENNFQTYLERELNDDLGLNLLEMDWRQYDYSIGRFVIVDPLADLFSQFDKSPYAYAWNNPIVFKDPTGLCPNGDCDDVGDNEEGATTTSDGSTWVVNNGSWVRDDGQLDEVTVVAPSSSEASNKPEPTPTKGMKSAKSYDYSHEVIPGKMDDDVDFILNGYEPSMNTMLHRLVAVIDRDLDADTESQEMVEILTLTQPLIRPVTPKPVSLPSVKKVKVDMGEVLSGHTVDGLRAKQSGIKDLFAPHLSPEQIKKLVLSAYKTSTKGKTQGDRVFLQGTASDGSLIEMWFNKVTRTIETAWPKY